MTLAGDLWLLVAVQSVALPVALGRLPLLCPAVFVAIGGGGTLSLLQHGWPVVGAVPVMVALGIAVGTAIGARNDLSDAALAVGTWGLGWLAQLLWLDVPSLAGGAAGVAAPAVPRLSLRSLGLAPRITTTELTVTALVAALVVAASTRAVRRSAAGQVLGAARTSPELVRALGGRPAAARRLALAASGGTGALAGAGIALSAGALSPGDAGPLLSVQLVLAALVTGSARWWGPAVGTGVLVGLDRLAGALPVRGDASTTTALVTVAALAVVLFARTVARRRRPVGHTSAVRGAAVGETPAARTVAAPDGVLLRLDGVVVGFGAVRALGGVSLDVAAGRVLGLVGANGSGKTTLLRVAAGAVTPSEGSRSLPRQTGVARAVQGGGLVDRLTVGDHARLAAACGLPLRGESLRRLLRTAAAGELDRRRAARAAAALGTTGLAAVADVATGSLDAGVRPLVAIACCIATGADVLLLDEPAAGMDRAARERLVPLLRRLADAGYGVVLADHDLDLVRSAADDVVLLQAGAVVERGAPHEVDLARLAVAPG